MNEKVTEKKYLKFYQKMAYGAGDLASNCSYGLVSSFLLLYLTSIMGMNSAVIGTLMLISKCLDGVTDVFFGNLIDRTHSKMGKARPWMLYAQIGVSVCLALLFSIPAGMGKTAQYAYFFVFYTCLNAIFYTANGIAYSSLTALITRNPNERVQLGSFRFMFAVATNIVLGFAVTSAVGAFGGGAGGWRMVAIVFAVIALVVNTISALAVKELPEEERPVNSEGKVSEDKLSFLDTIKILLKNKYYLLIVAIYIVYYIMSNLVTGSGVFFATYYLGNESIYGLLNMMKMFPVILALIIAPIIIKRVGNMQKVNTWGYAVSCILGIPLIYAAVTKQVTLFLIILFIKGVFAGFLSGSLNAFIAEASAYTTRTTGVRMDGTMYSCSSLGVKIGGGIGTAAVGWLLALGGFVNDAAVQTAGATNMILWIYLIIPVIIGVLITFLLSKLDVEKANQKWDEEHQNA